MVKFLDLSTGWADEDGPCSLFDQWSLIHFISGLVTAVSVIALTHTTTVPLLLAVILSHLGFVVWELIEILLSYYSVPNFPSSECWENRYVDILCCSLSFFIVFSVYVCWFADTSSYSRL